MKYWNEFELVAIWVKSNYPKIFDEAMNDIANREDYYKRVFTK